MNIQLDKKIYSSSLVQDFLKGSSKLEPFLNMGTSQDDFRKQMEKKLFSASSRQLLYNRLSFQYKRAQINEPDHLKDILDKNTFTVTTGHQLCLFGGPQYFIHKIVSAIKLADVLKVQFPEKQIIPMFWMASEDHDFKEISSAGVFSHNIQVEGEHKMAVGRLSPSLFSSALEDLKTIFKNDRRGDELITVFSDAFKKDNWSDATRYWVNHFFKDYGLLIIDGDDKELKKTMIPYFKNELEDRLTEKHVNITNKDLENIGYPIQVNPRPINLFYLDKQQRHRIVYKDDLYSIGSKSLTYNELIKKIESNPESFSPNVLLRPLYQELILPNIAYVGGAAEISYWSQLKGVFKAIDILFPKVVLRDSFAWISSKEHEWWREQGLSEKDLFIQHDLLIKKIIKNKKVMFDLTSEYQLLDQIKCNLYDKVNLYDKSLISHVESELKKNRKHNFQN